VRVIDGLVWDKRAFVIDDRCLYQKALVQGEGFETVACLTEKDMRLQSMAHLPQQGILMAAISSSRDKQESHLRLYAIDPGAGQTAFIEVPSEAARPAQAAMARIPGTRQTAEVPSEAARPAQAAMARIEPGTGQTAEVPSEAARPALPTTGKLLACGQKLWLFDQKSSALWNLDNGKWQVKTPAHGALTDLWCEGQDLMLLTVKTVADQQALWEAAVSQASSEDIRWSVRVGFDPTESRMMRGADGRWWWAAPSPITDTPIILMSHDGRKWSWRRDRVTDFHAVDVVSGVAAAVGDDGSVLISYDRGISWRPARTSTKRTLRDVCLSADGKFGIAVGDGGTILRAQSSIERWTRIDYDELKKYDLTSCAIVEQPDRFAVYIAGKGGLIYVSTERELGGFELVTSPSFEDLYALAALETGEVIAVGGNYQDPDRICEEGFIVIDGEHPKNMIWTLLMCLGLAAFWGYTVRNLIVGIARRRKEDEEEEEEVF